MPERQHSVFDLQAKLHLNADRCINKIQRKLSHTSLYTYISHSSYINLHIKLAKLSLFE